jgi:hypothetical protein
LAVCDFAKAYLDAFSFLRTRDSGAEAITVVSQVPVDAGVEVVFDIPDSQTAEKKRKRAFSIADLEEWQRGRVCFFVKLF